MTTKKLYKSPYLDEITEVDAVPLFNSIELALKGFRTKLFKNLKMSISGSRKSNPSDPLEEDFIKKKCVSDTNNSTAFLPTSTDSSVMRQKEKEFNDSATYPTNCQFCGGMLRAINKFREDRKLTLQCRRRKCMKFNGLVAEEQAKQILSEMARPKAPQIDYGWYLSDPVRHSYGIFAGDGDSSDSELDRSNVDVRPIIRDGNVMLRVFGQTGLG
ncbi:DNA mismatch repair protein MutL [Dirofilaria immitis]